MMIQQISDWLSIWITSRAMGITAYLLFFVSMATGMLQSMKGILPAYRAVLGLMHQSAGWFAWLFAFSHALVLVFDRYVGFSLKDLFVPFFSTYETLAMAAGIGGFYILLILLISSDVIRQIGRKLWRTIHALSFFGFAVTLYHGISFSESADSPFRFYLFGTTVATLLFLGLIRFLHARAPEKSTP